MSERYAVCMPLGLGVRGDDTSLRWDGERFECASFRVERGGVRVVARGASHFSVIDYASLRETRIQLDSTLASGLRDLVSSERAERLRATLDGSANGSKPHVAEISMGAIAAVCESREPEPIAALLAAAGSAGRSLSFGEHQALRALARVLLAELAIVCGASVEGLLGPLRERGGGFWDRLGPL